jgi:hypothetical protein
VARFRNGAQIAEIPVLYRKPGDKKPDCGDSKKSSIIINRISKERNNDAAD